MQVPSLLVSPSLLAVSGLDEIHSYVVVFESFGEAESSLLILLFWQDTDLIVIEEGVAARSRRRTGLGLDGDSGVDGLHGRWILVRLIGF